MMNPKVKKLWLEALRSGKYRQGIGALIVKENKHIKYCCLGVLTDVYCKRNKLSKEDSAEVIGDNALLPLDVMNWVGLQDDDPRPQVVGATLSQYNDTERLKFKAIANLIEKYL